MGAVQVYPFSGQVWDEAYELDEVVVLTGMVYPPEEHRPVVWYPVRDHEAPYDRDRWLGLCDWVLKQAGDGKRVGMCCVGGHGRTGLLVATLVGLAEPDIADPVATTRERYCDKAVESFEQEWWVYHVTGRDELAAEAWAAYKEEEAQRKTSWAQMKAKALMAAQEVDSDNGDGPDNAVI